MVVDRSLSLWQTPSFFLSTIGKNRGLSTFSRHVLGIIRYVSIDALGPSLSFIHVFFVVFSIFRVSGIVSNVWTAVFLSGYDYKSKVSEALAWASIDVTLTTTTFILVIVIVRLIYLWTSFLPDSVESLLSPSWQPRWAGPYLILMSPCGDPYLHWSHHTPLFPNYFYEANSLFSVGPYTHAVLCLTSGIE